MPRQARAKYVNPDEVRAFHLVNRCCGSRSKTVAINYSCTQLALNETYEFYGPSKSTLLCVMRFCAGTIGTPQGLIAQKCELLDSGMTNLKNEDLY